MGVARGSIVAMEKIGSGIGLLSNGIFDLTTWDPWSLARIASHVTIPVPLQDGFLLAQRPPTRTDPTRTVPTCLEILDKITEPKKPSDVSGIRNTNQHLHDDGLSALGCDRQKATATVNPHSPEATTRFNFISDTPIITT
jgi:hypothetical protein